MYESYDVYANGNVVGKNRRFGAGKAIELLYYPKGVRNTSAPSTYYLPPLAECQLAAHVFRNVDGILYVRDVRNEEFVEINRHNRSLKRA